MKGIILAAGKGTRMYPMTHPICKPLVPVYDKPLLYYPLSVLLMAGIDEVMIITPPDERDRFERVFGDGSSYGMRICYQIQKVQRGIADAFLIAEDFIGGDSVCLILGDNIFYGESLQNDLKKAMENKQGATVFGYWVENPRPFGVVEFDQSGKAISIEEKPQDPKSNYIVPGLYFYDNRVVEIAKTIEPSARGELEITSVNNAYLAEDKLSVVAFGEDVVWHDAGNADSLLFAANSICNVQKKSGTMVACPEEIAYRAGRISKEKLLECAEKLQKTNYGEYLLKLAQQ